MRECAVVGVTETCEYLKVCNTYEEAVEFIDTLPNKEQGIYYIDYPVQACEVCGLPDNCGDCDHGMAARREKEQRMIDESDHPAIFGCW